VVVAKLGGQVGLLEVVGVKDVILRRGFVGIRVPQGVGVGFGVQCPWRRRKVGKHLFEEIVVGSCVKLNLLLIVTAIVVAVKERVIVRALHFSTTRLHEKHKRRKV